jgi:hypothetical protein
MTEFISIELTNNKITPVCIAEPVTTEQPIIAYNVRSVTYICCYFIYRSSARISPEYHNDIENALPEAEVEVEVPPDPLENYSKCFIICLQNVFCSYIMYFIILAILITLVINFNLGKK